MSVEMVLSLLVKTYHRYVLDINLYQFLIYIEPTIVL